MVIFDFPGYFVKIIYQDRIAGINEFVARPQRVKKAL